MMLVVYIVVAVLTLAVCVLYAMVGELAGRVLPPGEQRRTDESAEPKAIDGANIGAELVTMPAPIGSDAEALADLPADFGVVVLSTICNSCFSFARSLSGSPKAEKLPGPLFVVISAPTQAEAEKFVSDTGLGHVRTLTLLWDPLGQWCRTALGLNVSPSLVRVIGSHIRGAWSMSSFTAIPVLWEPPAQMRASIDQPAAAAKAR